MSIQPAQDALAPVQEPDQVLELAHRAARALVRAVAQNEAQYVVALGQSRHLRFEAWQTLGAFFSMTASIEWTRQLENGWEARAVVRRGDHVVSAAEAQCTTDEPGWNSKPSFQLRSMAQTRAAAKALRQALAWVVVLAGYQPTPAEEVEGTVVPSNHAPANTPMVPPPSPAVTNAQLRAIWSRWRELAREGGFEPSAEGLRALVRARYGVEHSRDLTRAQASRLIDFLYSSTPQEVAQALKEAQDAAQPVGNSDV